MSDILSKAIEFSKVLLAEKKEFTAEEVLSHCDGVCRILLSIGASQHMQAAIYLAHVSDVLSKPKETYGKPMESQAKPKDNLRKP